MRLVWNDGDTPRAGGRATDDGVPGRRRWRGPVVVLATAIVLVLAGRIAESQGMLDLHYVAAWLEPVARVWWSPLAVIALFIVFNVFGLPGSVLTLACGVVWGWVIGGTIALVGSVLGTALPYFLARRHAPWAEHHMRRRAARLHARLQRDSFMTMLLLRLVPAVPYAVTNYAAGFAGVRPIVYFSATLLGTIPGDYIYAFLAHSIFNGDLTLREAVMRIAFAGVLLGAIVLGARYTARKHRIRGRGL